MSTSNGIRLSGTVWNDPLASREPQAPGEINFPFDIGAPTGEARPERRGSPATATANSNVAAADPMVLSQLGQALAPAGHASPVTPNDLSPALATAHSANANANLPMTNARATLTGFYNDATALNISASGTYTINGKQYALDGSGLTIGVISNSFDASGTGYAGEINAGLLPGVSSLHVLSDITDPASDDEGRAMAELIHAAVPGATIDFAAYDANDPGGPGGGLVAFGQAVTSLADAGCKIIVDDITPFDASSFQIGSPLDTAIEQAIRTKGVSYFTSAGNLGRSYQDLNFVPVPVLQDDGSTQIYAKFNNSSLSDAQEFSTTSSSPITIFLQWNQNFAGYAPVSKLNNDQLQVEIYVPSVLDGSPVPLLDARGNPVISTPLKQDPGDPVSIVTFDPQGYTDFYIAVRDVNPSLNNGTLTRPIEFKYFARNNDITLVGATAGQSGGDLIGQDLLPDVNVVGAIDYKNTPAFNGGRTAQLVPEPFSSFGPDVINFGSSGAKNVPATSTPGPEFGSVDDGTTGVPGFAPFKGTSAAAPNAAAVAALILEANPNLTPAQVTQVLEQSAIALPGSGDPTNPNYKYQVGAGLIQADKAVALAIAAAACFAAGTRVLTTRGEVPVEQLRSGDIVVTRFGRLRPIIWVGRRDIDVSRQPDPHLVHPVRIAAGALGHGQPHRDLFVSREHAILVGDVLVPARCLVNGTSIRQVPVDHVSYFHIELAAHDLLVVEGLLAESWLDTGNRAMFQNAAVATLLADLSGERREPSAAGRTCVPLVDDGPRLVEIYAKLSVRDKTMTPAATPQDAPSGTSKRG